MTAYENLAKWIEISKGSPFPPMDEDGRTQFSMGGLDLYAKADPAPGDGPDPIYFWTPLLSAQGASPEAEREFFLILLEDNLPGELPTGFKVSVNADGLAVYLGGQFSADLLDAPSLLRLAEDFLRTAQVLRERYRGELGRLIEENPGGPAPAAPSPGRGPSPGSSPGSFVPGGGGLLRV